MISAEKERIGGEGRCIKSNLNAREMKYNITKSQIKKIVKRCTEDVLEGIKDN